MSAPAAGGALIVSSRMEGFVAALVVSGAAIVTAQDTGAPRARLQAALRALLLVAAALALAALVTGFVLLEWLTVSWAFGLSSCCLARGVPVGLATWPRRVVTVVILTLSVIGVVMCVEGLVPDAPWAISQALARVEYRSSTELVVLGNGVLNITALLIAAQRVRRDLRTHESRRSDAP